MPEIKGLERSILMICHLTSFLPPSQSPWHCLSGKAFLGNPLLPISLKLAVTGFLDGAGDGAAVGEIDG